MSSRKKLTLTVLLVSLFCLVYYIVISLFQRSVFFLDIRIEADEPIVRLVEQRLGFWEKRTEENALSEIHLQQTYADGEAVLFLPGYYELSEVYVTYAGGSDKVQAMEFDGNKLAEGDVLRCENLLEENHCIAFNNKKNYFTVLQGSKLPTAWLCIEENMDYIHESQENRSGGRLTILDEAGNVEYAGGLEYIKGRGNSSWTMPKRSYGIKLMEAASLLDMTPGKSWVLQGGGADKTNLRNKIFMDMAVNCGLENAVESRWLDLYVNGEYYGCYLLTEKIAVADGRLEIGDLEGQTELVNEKPLDEYGHFEITADMPLSAYMIPGNPPDISGGYLLEVETYEQRYVAEPCAFITTNEIPILVKYPRYASHGQVVYIASVVQEFENALYDEDGYNALGMYYLDYIDLESFALRYLVDEISKNVDAGYSSYFLYKPRGDRRLYAGPVWDYDTALGNSSHWGDVQELSNPEGLHMNKANWSEQLWFKDDFRAAVKEVYRERVSLYLDYLVETGIDEYVEAIYASTYMEAVCYGTSNLDEQIEYVKDFLEKRRDYLEDEFVRE